MDAHLKKLAAVAFLVFLGLWIGGTARGFALPYPEPIAFDLSVFDRATNARQQGWNNLKQMGLATTPLPLVLEGPDVEQIEVYERIAQLSLATRTFEDTQALVRSVIAGHKGVVFNESASGLAPDRQVTFEVGVHPEKFDAVLEQLKDIGDLQFFSVQQRDRTADFRRLNAQRQALKKHLEAVLKLRGVKEASIDDSLKIEQKLQDIEKELQALAVQLGDLLGKESYYHIQLSLREFQSGSRHDRTYTLPQRVFRGFVWAAGWWFAGAFGVAVVVGTVVSVRVLWMGAKAS